MAALTLAATVPAWGVVWSGGSLDGDEWSRLDNWEGAPPNSYEEDAVFGPHLLLPRYGPTVDGDFNVKSIVFDSDSILPALPYTLAGSGSLSVDAGISNVSPSFQNIDVDVTTGPGNNGMFEVRNFGFADYGRLEFNGDLTLDKTSLFRVASSEVFVNQELKGTGDIVKLGPGRLNLLGEQTREGGLEIRQGTVRVSELARLRDEENVVIRRTGTLRIDGVTDVIAGVNGGGFSTANAQIEIVNGGNLIIGNFAGTNSPGDGDFDGVISGTGMLTKRGTDGTLTVSGSNTYTGGTLIDEGTVVVDSAATGLGAGTTTIDRGGVLRGSGALGGAVTVVDHGVIAPRVDNGGPATLGFDTLVIGSNGHFETFVENDGAGALRGDQLVATGDLDLGIASYIDVHSAAQSGLPSLEANERLTLIQAGSITGQPGSVSLPSAAVPGHTAWVIDQQPGRIDLVLGLQGDADLSGQVEQGDLDAVLQNWGDAVGGPSYPTAAVWLRGDLNHNGQVEQGDLDMVLQNWGNLAAPDFSARDGTSVPEPGLAGAGLLALGCAPGRRRR